VIQLMNKVRPGPTTKVRNNTQIHHWQCTDRPTELIEILPVTGFEPETPAKLHNEKIGLNSVQCSNTFDTGQIEGLCPHNLYSDNYFKTNSLQVVGPFLKNSSSKTNGHLFIYLKFICKNNLKQYIKWTIPTFREVHKKDDQRLKLKKRLHSS